MRAALAQHGIDARLTVSNDADAVAAGIAATHSGLDKLIRVWTLGEGIGFGHYPESEGVWEGGHTVVSLDPNENFCGCGGRGHLEGIMGHRAMRLRFLDREPEEVFAAARSSGGPTLCRVRAVVASGAGRGHGHQYSPGRPGQILYHGNERALCQSRIPEPLRSGDGQAEPFAQLRV